jgi:phage gpG-like protein
VLRAGALALREMSRRSFTNTGLRSATWKRRKKNYGHPILLKSGALRKSIAVQQVTDDYCYVGSDRKYAAVHQFGSRKRRGRGSGIPARPFFPVRGTPTNARFTPKARDAVNRAIRRKVDSILS